MVITFNDISFVFQKLDTFFSTVSFVVHLSAVGRNRHTSNVRNPTRNHSNKPLKKTRKLADTSSEPQGLANRQCRRVMGIVREVQIDPNVLQQQQLMFDC